MPASLLALLSWVTGVNFPTDVTVGAGCPGCNASLVSSATFLQHQTCFHLHIVCPKSSATVVKTAQTSGGIRRFGQCFCLLDPAFGFNLMSLYRTCLHVGAACMTENEFLPAGLG